MSGFDQKLNQNEQTHNRFIGLLITMYSDEKKEKDQISSYSIEVGLQEGIRKKNLINGQNQFTNFHSIEKISSPYEKFVSFFFYTFLI